MVTLGPGAPVPVAARTERANDFDSNDYAYPMVTLTIAGAAQLDELVSERAAAPQPPVLVVEIDILNAELREVLEMSVGRPIADWAPWVRAIAGLWPWGAGEVRVQVDGLFVMPQRPYVPLGTLRRAVTALTHPGGGID